MLIAVGFAMPDLEGWPSVLFHPQLKLLLVVYVDNFKMSGPKEPMTKGWELVGSKIDMDVPTDIGRYLGCDHVQELQVKLSAHDHPCGSFVQKALPDQPPRRPQLHRGLKTFGKLTHQRLFTYDITVNRERDITFQMKRSSTNVT